MYFKKLQITLLKLLYQTGPKSLKFIWFLVLFSMLSTFEKKKINNFCSDHTPLFSMIGHLLSPFLSACLDSNNHPSVDFFQKRKPTKLSQCKLQSQVLVLRIKAFFLKKEKEKRFKSLLSVSLQKHPMSRPPPP